MDKQQQINMALVELEKSYDSAPLCNVWGCLDSGEMEASTVGLVKILYRDNSVREKDGGGCISQQIRRL